MTSLGKVLAIVLAAVLVFNLVGVAIKIIPPLVFWVVLILAAIIAWKIIPKIKK